MKKQKETKFTLQEIQELNWIVHMYKDTHKGHYQKRESRVLNNIIKKLIKMELKIVLEEKPRSCCS